MNLDTENNKLSTKKIVNKIFSHLSLKRKKETIYVFILSIFSSLAESVSIALLIPFIGFFLNPDTYLANDFFKMILNFFGASNQKEMFKFASFLFILMVILSSLIKLRYIRSSNSLADNITSDFRIKIFNFLLNQDYSYYFKHGSNEIMSNLAQKTGFFSTMIFAAMNIVNAILISTAIFIVLIINEPYYTPIIIFTVLIFFFITFKIKSKSVIKKGNNLSLNQNFIIDIFENTIGYLQEIFVYNLNKFFSSILIKASKETAKSSSEIRTISMLPRIYLETFVITFVILLIYFSDFTDRSTLINISFLAILAFAAQKCLPLINSIYQLSILFKGATPAVSSFLKILDKDKKKSMPNNEIQVLEFKKNIKLENLSFRYSEISPYILKKINIEIFKGEKVAIKGQTGSGKTTLINLILGLLSPSNGKIFIDNKEINSKNISSWQKNLALVPQTVFLNDASILENIAIGQTLDQIDHKKVISAAKLAQLDDFINDLPDKYNQKVGEKGIRLSGGQRQRVGIARAIYRNSNLIILDEPTNALDLETENLVLSALLKLDENMTIIMISHNNNSLSRFNKIIDLDNLN